MKIRELDPPVWCGAATSVERLFRVQEVIGKATSWHLVFLDRHGWYCEHGPGCPVVRDVRRQDGVPAR